ncbi:O-succinylbenzoic acid--CoA ligase [Aeromicrobium panaciterrae]|uniref:O-succinylbenzoic acid--CoA ligase n=1 Tax=Aeromicrobium panaciterrae TaxID=363861 RepID=A0ABU1URW6_9ACTN|nr:AMP-binding protein [Aeromicrobium panaciterrae]MDR7087883.1 O-succinylbenzoic acid--CoA ligase [Aeromicrobium panaciterrae]
MSLRPVAGSPREVLALLEPWVRDGGEPIVVRTSGSTGTAKDVVLSHAAVMASAHAALDRLGGPGQWLSAIPATGVGGLQVLVRSIIAGTDPVFADEYDDIPSAIAGMNGDRRYASLVPTQLHRLADNLSVLSGLDAVVIGGAATPGSLLAQSRDAGVNVVRAYGMSETCGGCVYDGVPLDGVQIRVDDEHQVHLAGPMLFDRYGDPDVPTDVVDGWFATNDLGEIDDHGRLTITGRSDDVIISGGVNIPLPAVTEALRGHEGVGDAIAVGVPDDEWGTRVVAYVVPADAVCLDGLRLDEVRDAIEAAGLPRTWAPREVVLVDALPLLPGGKVDRQALRRL